MTHVLFTYQEGEHAQAPDVQLSESEKPLAIVEKLSVVHQCCLKIQKQFKQYIIMHLYQNLVFLIFTCSMKY